MLHNPKKNKAALVIIGAGIIGVSIAYHLAKRGIQDIIILDKAKAGSGSTAAALGGFRHQFSNELSVQLSKESIAEIENFKALTGYDPLVRHDGYLFIASKEASLRQLEKNSSLQKALGVEVELLSQKELVARYPFYSFKESLGGTLCMQDGHASTFAVHQGYLSKARELGVECYENTRVEKIETTGAKVAGVKTERGNISCDKIIIAAGAYSGLVGGLAAVSLPIMPYPRKILVTQNFIDEIPPEIPLIIDMDSTLAIGREGKGIIMSDNQATEPSFELRFPPDFDERIISLALARVPSLARTAVSYSVEGLYEMTPDANPIVSAIPSLEGLYCCAGFAGHGFMHAPSIGKIMSEIVLGEQPHLDVSAFRLERFAHATAKEGLII